MSILDDLFYGRISPWEDNSLAENAEYKEITKVRNKTGNKLRESLNEEQKKMLEQYMNACNDVIAIVQRESYKAGFQLAAKLLMEMFSSQS